MKNKNEKDSKKKTSIGGQALIEGIMMRGPNGIAIAVRKPDGEIALERKNVKMNAKKDPILKVPVIRGIIEFFRMMVVGVKALMYSASFIELEEEEPAEENQPGEENQSAETEKVSRTDAFLEKVFGDKLKDAVIYFSVVLSIFFSVGLFMLLPNLLSSLLPIDRKAWGGNVITNLIEGAIRISIFFGYIILTSKMKDIKRVWQYHGAEHKTISCYENECDLTVENVRTQSRLHPRCGTSFLFIVMIISTLVFSFTGWGSIWKNILTRIILVPFVAGISYEILKLVGRYDNAVTRALRMPGMFLQLFTTAEPDDSQIEVAIVAFENVQTEDASADVW